MQTSSAHFATAFGRQRPKYCRPTLSSDIVRPVFQRDVRSNDSIFIENRDTEPPKLPERGIKRVHSLTTSRSPRMPVDQEQFFDTESEQFERKPKRIRRKTERRREQCRVNQARYRLKQLDRINVVEQTIQKLRADIPVLELLRNLLLYGGQQDVWNVVVEYFKNFRFGVPMDLPDDDGVHAATSLPKCVNSAEAKHQLAFLRSSMAGDVILGERRGVDALMQQWQRYSQSFRSLFFELKRIERTNEQFVNVSAKMTVVVSEATLENVFPHVRAPYLRSRLLGQRLELPCTLCFEWDELTGRVVRLETTANFVTPLLKALGDLSSVAFVMEQARITRDGAVGVRDASLISAAKFQCHAG